MGSKAPASPDYRGAAEQTAASDKAALTQQTWANRPTINTPWGQQSWQAGSTIDPSTGQSVTDWTQNITLSPEQQAALDAQQRITQGRSDAAEGLLGQATSAFDKPFDWEGAPKAGSMEGMDPAGARNRAEQALWQRNISKIEPMLTQSEDARRARLANMGIALEGGSEAFGRAQSSMDMARQKAYQDAAYSSIIGGGQEATREQGMGIAGAQEQDRQRSQWLTEEAQRRNMPLNELNALLTAQQVQSPQFSGPNQTAGRGQATDYLGAAGMQGNFDQANAQQAGGMWGGLGQLAGTGASMFMMSDIRLKSNIRRIGTHRRGVGIYTYDMFGKRHVGVMAQELMQVAPELVRKTPSGYLCVNYGEL